MLQQQSATFLRHFLNRLLHYRQLRMNQGSQGCARHAAERHILRNAQATLRSSVIAEPAISYYLLLITYDIRMHHYTADVNRKLWIFYFSTFSSKILMTSASGQQNLNSSVVPSGSWPPYLRISMYGKATCIAIGQSCPRSVSKS